MRPSSGVLALAALLLVPACARDYESGGEVQSDASGEDAVLDPSRQRRTVADIRNVGTALMSWVTDQIEYTPPAPGATAAPLATPAPAGTADDGSARVADYPRISHAELSGLLAPQYIAAVPERDAWGHEIEYYLVRDPVGDEVILVRSPGRDGVFEGDVYLPGTFEPGAAGSDLVWADGYFVRSPQPGGG